MNTARSILLPCAILLLFSGCGGAQKASGTAPIDLLKKGNYTELQTALTSKENQTSNDHALLALAILAKNPNAASARLSIETLTTNKSEIESSIAATQMLAYAFDAPANPSEKMGILLCETALGAAGYGKLAKSTSTPESGSLTANDLAIAVIERLNLWLGNTKYNISNARLMNVWNGAYSLLGGSMKCDTDIQAWKLFSSLGGITLAIWEEGKRRNFVDALLNATLETVEYNSRISIAAKCDLSSPYEKLRALVSSNSELLGRLERAVATAAGCTRGKYAPK